MPNELDAIQQQMAALGIDVSPEEQAPAPDMWGAEFTAEDEAMFQPGGEYAVEEAVPMPEEQMPMEEQIPQELTINDLWDMVSQVMMSLDEIKNILINK